MTEKHLAFVRCYGVRDADDLTRLANHGRGLGKAAEERRLEDLPDDAPRAVFFRHDFRPELGGVGCDIPQADLRPRSKATRPSTAPSIARAPCTA